jgi:hypothetical protein
MPHFSVLRGIASIAPMHLVGTALPESEEMNP